MLSVCRSVYMEKFFIKKFTSSYLKHISFLLLRIAFGIRLIIGTQDNVFHKEHMLEFVNFLSLYNFPFPELSAYLSVYFQFLAGIFWIIGYQVRLGSFIMVLNFLIALFMVHLEDTYLNAAPAIHLLVVSFFLLINGGGKYSIDSYFSYKK